MDKPPAKALHSVSKTELLQRYNESQAQEEKIKRQQENLRSAIARMEKMEKAKADFQAKQGKEAKEIADSLNEV